MGDQNTTHPYTSTKRMSIRSKQFLIAVINTILVALHISIAAGLQIFTSIISILLTIRRVLESDIRSSRDSTATTAVAMDPARLKSIHDDREDPVADLQKVSLKHVISAMQYAVQCAKNFASALEETVESFCELGQAFKSATQEAPAATAAAESPKPSNTHEQPAVRPFKARPAPIDIQRAQRQRVFESLPRIETKAATSRCRTPMTCSSRYSTESESSVDSVRVGPSLLSTQVYTLMRSPASSTPFPSTTSLCTTPCQGGHDARTMMSYTPVTTRYTASPPLSSSSSHKARTIITTPASSTADNALTPSSSSYSVSLQEDQNSPFIPTDFYSTMQTATYPYTRSKRLERMLMALVEPLDTDTTGLQGNADWWRVRTPLPGRWDLFRSPTQVRLGVLMERAWCGIEDGVVGGVAGEFEDEIETGDEDEEEGQQEDDDGRERMLCVGGSEAFVEGGDGQDNDDNDDGWKGLPSPISPLCI